MSGIPGVDLQLFQLTQIRLPFLTSEQSLTHSHWHSGICNGNQVSSLHIAFSTVTSGYDTWFTAGGAIRIGHYDVITQKL